MKQILSLLSIQLTYTLLILSTANLDMKVIKKYLKNNNKINSDSIESPHLPSFKSYMKITRLSYTLEYTNSPIIPDILESVIKEIYP